MPALFSLVRSLTRRLRPRRPGAAHSKYEEPFDAKLVASMRLILAASAMAIIAIDPSEPTRLASVIYSVVGAYTLYSAAVYLSVVRGARLATRLAPIEHWIDVAWYTLLVSLSDGTESLFVFGYVFTTLVAAFRNGRACGLRVTVVSALLFATVGYMTGVAKPFELNRFALRPTFLLVLGYMMASVGGHETMLRRRLQLLRDVSVIGNPRFGVDHTIGHLLARVRAYYDAELCLLVMRDGDGGQLTCRRADRATPHGGVRATTLPVVVAERLLALAPECAVVLRPHGGWLAPQSADAPAAYAAGEHILTTLDTPEVLTVPILHHDEYIGRVFVTSPLRPFSRADPDLLAQVVRQVMPVVDNIRLVDRLASEAAANERRRIARDIHDSVIQSFIGVQLAVEAIHGRLQRGLAIDGAVQNVSRMVGTEVGELRRYVSSLEGGHSGTNALTDALQRFTAKFSEATGIHIFLDIAASLHVTDRVAAEAFQFVEEAVSNIRRHTLATRAVVRIGAEDKLLLIRIENLHIDDAPAPFVPKSIATRARALGGRVKVDTQHGRTVVAVRIPL